MARTSFEGKLDQAVEQKDQLTFQAHGEDRIELPSSEFISDAHMTRDGDDLILETPNGEVAVVEGYFAADPSPLLQSPEGAVLTPDLVDSFARSPQEYASNETASDASPVGAIEEVKGEVKVTRADGTVETVTIGTPIYEGDIIETDASGAVNIVFIDETSMAISENARMAIDQYNFDPSTESGTTNFSVLRGLFVFTSGLIGRDDPDDVHINTPVGSIGIRGTIIAGQIDPNGESNISVLEGAIVVKNGLGETTLSDQFETVKLTSFDAPMESLGVVAAADITARFSSVGNVVPTLFSTINETVQQQSSDPSHSTQPQNEAPSDQPAQQQQMQQQEAPTAPTPAPEPVSQLPTTTTEVISLNNNGSGLPSTSTVLGQTDTLATSTNTTTTSSSSSTSTSSGSGVISPLPTTSTSTTETTTTTTTSAITNPVTNPVIIGGTGSTVGTTPPPSPSMAYAHGTFTGIAHVGNQLGIVNTSNMPTGVTYTLTGSTHYALDTTGATVKVVLTADGAKHLTSTLDRGLTMESFTITATDTSGTVASTTYTPSIGMATSDNVKHVNTGYAFITDSINNLAGYSITAMGDRNGDGFDDFMFSNNVNDLLGTTQPHAYQVSGTGNMMNDGMVPGLANPYVPDFGGNTSESKIASIGDFDGDGKQDYVVGQFLNDTTVTGTGNAAIISGVSTQHIKFGSGGLPGISIGSAVDGAGDFNNDGYADVIIGASNYATGDGAAYFIQGGTAWGSALSPTAIMPSTPAASSFGRSVRGIGDFNGDGYSDFAVGAPTDGTNNEGSVSIYLGNKDGDVTTSNFYTITTSVAASYIGDEIISLGDIDGDGRSDIFIGGLDNKGSILLGENTTGVGSISDIATVREAVFNIPLTSTVGGTTFSHYISGGNGVGDFNGDGYDDFAISINTTNMTTSDAYSETYVVFGKDGFSGSIDFAFLNNTNNAMKFKYGNVGSTSDIEVSGVGDINGDGYDDFAMGVPDLNGPAGGNGGVIVVYGRESSAPGGATTTATMLDRTLVGTTGNDTLSDGGYANVSMRGGAGNDVFQISNQNFLGIDGGTNTSSGYDTIKIMGNLDFTGVEFEQISGIEMLQFNGTGKTMTLTLENIFNLLKTSDTGDLKIDSIGTNTLNIQSSATGTSTSAVVSALDEMAGTGKSSFVGVEGPVGGDQYNHFKIGGYDLYIDTQVVTNV